MQSNIESPLAAAAVVLPPPRKPPDHFERRVVEHSNQGSLHPDEHASNSHAAAAVVQLVRRSAEAFSELLEQLRDPAAAAAMSGFSAAGNRPPGRIVDVYV